MIGLAKVGGVALMIAVGLVGCRGQQGTQQVQAPPPPDAYAAQPQPFEPIQVQPGPQPMDPYAAPGNAPNAAAPAPVADPSGGTSLGGTYTVQKGDTLWSIAVRHYGSGQRWVDILNANPGLNPNKMPVGKAIVLP